MTENRRSQQPDPRPLRLWPSWHSAVLGAAFTVLPSCVIVDGEETEEGFRGTCQRYTGHLPTCGEPVETEEECVVSLKMLAESVSHECAYATQSLIGCYASISCDIWDEREIGCEDPIRRTEELCPGP